jgi:uncharacterized protein YoxC
MQNAVTAVLDRRLEGITHTLDELKDNVRLIKDDVRIMKDDIKDMKEDIRHLMTDVVFIARTATLVSFHSDDTR